MYMLKCIISGYQAICVSGFDPLGVLITIGFGGGGGGGCPGAEVDVVFPTIRSVFGPVN